MSFFFSPRKSHFYERSTLWHKLLSCLLIWFFCSVLWPKNLGPQRRSERDCGPWHGVWQAAIVYPTQAGTSGPASASMLEACSLQTCLFFHISPAISPSSFTFQIWWFGSGSYNFFKCHIFTDFFYFFLASFIVVSQFHTHLWKIWSLRSQYKISANIWTQSSGQWQHHKASPTGSTCGLQQPSLSKMICWCHPENKSSQTRWPQTLSRWGGCGYDILQHLILGGCVTFLVLSKDMKREILSM